jgi:Methyltransferase domain
MSPTNSSNPYDAEYYEHSCGQPYRHDAVWLQFFGFVADHIAGDIHPNTVFDAGCAMGFLVECLRQRGVAAWGVDISEYAIQNVQPEVRPYCRLGSITDPLPQRHDLIVCIEIVEHLTASEGEKAIRNLCNYTDDILFSSTPFDFTEPTHVNVQPPEYWAELFARYGFFHDLDFDASFISNWAMRFRKKQVSTAQLVSAYERCLWQLTFANRSQSETLENLRSELAAKKDEL